MEAGVLALDLPTDRQNFRRDGSMNPRAIFAMSGIQITLVSRLVLTTFSPFISFWYLSIYALRILPFECTHYQNICNTPFHGLQDCQLLLDIIHIRSTQISLLDPEQVLHEYKT